MFHDHGEIKGVASIDPAALEASFALLTTLSPIPKTATKGLSIFGAADVGLRRS